MIRLGPPTEGKPPPELREPAPTQADEKPPAKIKVRLADGKERQLQHMAATSFWSAERTAAARAATAAEFTDKQRAFIDFVLAQYVVQGVEELDAGKLSALLKLEYHDAIADAFAELGRPDEVRQVFVGFQRHLYSAQGLAAHRFR